MGAQGFSEVIVWGDVRVSYPPSRSPHALDANSAYKVLCDEAQRRVREDYEFDPGPGYDGTIATTSIRKVFSTPLTLEAAYSFLMELDAAGKGAEKFECDAVALSDESGNHAGWVFSGIASM